MTPRIRIVSYFSIPTDLAGAMREWPEFVGGSDYDVNLRSAEEEVELRYKDGEDESYVLVSSSVGGPLLERVVGLAVHAMSARSDYLMVYRCAGEPIKPPQRNAGSRPSSGDSPASETPSSLGPRG